jgi:hypothetical protein
LAATKPLDTSGIDDIEEDQDLLQDQDD